MTKKKDKSFEKKEILKDVAIKEFGEKGYKNASLNNIIKNTGISKGTFYYHFKNKEDLYFYLIEILIDEKKKFFSENIDPKILNSDFFTILGSLTKAGLQFAKQNPTISKFSESLIKDKENKMYDKMIDKYGHQSEEFLEGFIERAYKKGELRNDLSKDFVKHIITYIFTHIPQMTNIMELEDFKKATDDTIKFLKNGLAKENTKP